MSRNYILHYKKALRFLLVAAGLLLHYSGRTQCNIVPNVNISITNDSMTVHNISTGTVAGTSYLWVFYKDVIDSSGNPSGNNTFSSTLSSPPAVTYTANGGYKFKLSASNSPTCPTYNLDTMVVICTFTPNLTYTIGANGHVTFSVDAVGPGVTSLIWSFGDGAVDSVYNPMTHVYANGSFPVQAWIYYSNGLCAKTPSTVITITNNICPATAAFFYTTAAAGVVDFSASAVSNPNMSFSWNFGDGVISYMHSPTHVYGNGGNYKVKLAVTSTSPFCGDTTTLNVNITTVPCTANSNFSIVPEGTPHLYNIIPAYPYNGSQFTWSWGDGSSSTGNSINASHTYSAAGNYNICLTMTTNCNSTSSTCVNQFLAKGTSAGDLVQIWVTPAPLVLGLHDLVLGHNLQIYPNPSTDGILNIHLDQQMSLEEIVVYDLLGKQVYLEKPGSAEQGLYTLKLDQLNNGIYFVQLKLPHTTFTSKIILSKQ